MGTFLYVVWICALIILLSAFECAFPAERGQPLRERLRNVVFIGVFVFLGAWITNAIVQALPFLQRQITETDESLLGVAFLVFVALFLTDVLFYWYHRAQHTFPWLWAIHELHHRDANLNVTTSLRTHVFEYPIQALLIGLPVGAIVGLDSSSLFFFAATLTAWEFFTHTNLRLRLGLLTSIFCGPQVHRIHHSRLPEHQNKNFAQTFPILDILFGTYVKPAKDEFPPTGIEGKRTDIPILNAVAGPVLVWFGQKQE